MSMQGTHATRASRAWPTGLVALAQLAHLAWDSTHGGIPSHHLLNRADLPAVSNAWGVVVLPALAWWLIGRIQQRLGRARMHGQGTRRARTAIAVGFVVAAAVGIALSVAFMQGAQDVASAVFMGTLLAALVLPAYRAECVLGFVLAMAFVFGPVLPVAIGGAIALVSFVSTRYVLGTIVRWATAMRKRRDSGHRRVRAA